MTIVLLVLGWVAVGGLAAELWIRWCVREYGEITRSGVIFWWVLGLIGSPGLLFLRGEWALFDWLIEYEPKRKSPVWRTRK